MVRQSEESSSNLRKLLQERIDKANPRRVLNSGEERRLSKREAIAARLKRGENLQNRQLQTWLSEDESAEIEAEWQGLSDVRNHCGNQK